MPRVRILLICALIAITWCFCFRQGERRALSPGASSAASIPARRPDIWLSAVPETPASRMPATAAVETAASPEVLERFDAWTADFVRSPESERDGLVAEGMKLAMERRPVFKALIIENPREAIQKAVPMVVRQKLPPEIVSLLEKRINAIGALRVFQGVPLDLNDPPVPTTREVELKSGGTYRAYVYGEREKKLTWTPGASVNGVASRRGGWRSGRFCRRGRRWWGIARCPGSM
jgi:hypothetical protein